MRRPHRLVAAVAAGAAFVMPSAPAHALPHCGGTWVGAAQCGFEAPLGAFGIAGTAFSANDTATVTVRVLVSVGSTLVVVGSCTNSGPSPVTCTAIVASPFPGMPHTCEVSGRDLGLYNCADPPYVAPR